ncbi:MAG: cation diffusion facilitator family transporter [Gemmatimonadaceae bacterium]
MPDAPIVAPDRTGAIQRTLAIILVLNVMVVAAKLVVALRTGSLTVIGATLESALDAMNNVVAIVVVALAARGPDDDHPYGHDKFETMGALAIVGFLSISCFELIHGAVTRLLEPVPLAYPGTPELLLLGATGIVNVVVVAYERRRAAELRSPLLLADAAHTMGDLGVTALAIASLGAARLGFPWLDPILAIVVALVIAWSGWQILRVTVPVLVDARGVSADKIRAATLGVAGVASVPTIRSRTNSSGLVFADVTITVAAEMRVAAAHAVADAVETAVRSALDGAADVTVHVEPT